MLGWRLCGVLDLVKFALLAVVDEGLLENWEVLVSLDAAEAFLCFEHSGCGPAQGHPGVSPAFHIPADLPDDTVHGLNYVRTGQ